MFKILFFFQDPTAAHYKYHDDPYLIPTSNTGKRTFAMAQESGRKAAQWIRENNRQWFGVGFYTRPLIQHKLTFYIFLASRS